MFKLSTGHDSTLGAYRDLCAAVFGETSNATKYFDDKIKQSPGGRDEEVLAPESQMMQVVGELVRKDLNERSGTDDRGPEVVD